MALDDEISLETGQDGGDDGLVLLLYDLTLSESRKILKKVGVQVLTGLADIRDDHHEAAATIKGDFDWRKLDILLESDHCVKVFALCTTKNLHVVIRHDTLGIEFANSCKERKRLSWFHGRCSQ